MAAVTLTMTPYARTFDQKTVHTGLNVVYAEKTATICVSGKILAAKLPHGARVIDGWIAFDTAGEIGCGTSASLDAFISTASVSGVNRFFSNVAATRDGAGYKVSVSDDAVQRWTAVKISAYSASIGGSPLKFCIQYLMDGD